MSDPLATLPLSAIRVFEAAARLKSFTRAAAELNITQEGVPAVIPAQACYMGWQESLTMLAQLVEPEIPDES